MDEMQRPIGVFDSGVGGISVLRELVALMPNENFIWGFKKCALWNKDLRGSAETHTGRCGVLKVAECKSTGCRMQHGDKRSDSHFKGKISERDPGHRN